MKLLFGDPPRLQLVSKLCTNQRLIEQPNRIIGRRRSRPPFGAVDRDSAEPVAAVSRCAYLTVIVSGVQPRT